MISEDEKATLDETDDALENLNHDIDQNLITLDSGEDDNDSDEAELQAENEVYYVKPKILYCSRTHSQLSQFINEVKKTVYADSIRLLHLGSRATLCVNPNVRKFGSANLMNEKCLEMQKKSKKCSFLKRNVLEDIRDDILSQIQDIEEVYSTGCSLKACSYYSSRLAVSEAQVLAIPYNILLHKKTRESFGISLKDNVVIIDEAHNLVEAIHGIYSVKITGGQVLDCLSQLNHYMIRYNTRLSPYNLMNLKQLSLVITSLVKIMKLNLNQKINHSLYTPVEFTTVAEIDNFNLFKLVQFCEKSQIARKLFGFSKTLEVSNHEKQTQGSLSGTATFLAKLKAQKASEMKKKPKNKEIKADDETSGPTDSKSHARSNSPLYQIIEFIRCLTNPPSDGRILLIVNKSNSRESTLKFLLLNPANQFRDIVEESRSVILIGGTMEPFSEFIDHLFEPIGVRNERIVCFSCDHIVPKENLLPICLSKDSTGKVIMHF